MTRRVRVNVVAPGATDTSMLRSRYSYEAIEQTQPVRTPTGRLATSAQIAAGILFFLSDAADFVAGAHLPVDGGLPAGWFNNEEVGVDPHEPWEVV